MPTERRIALRFSVDGVSVNRYTFCGKHLGHVSTAAPG
jgi:hypothetical protein